MKRWAWLVQYAVAVVMALLLGTILGGVHFFQNTWLGSTGLSAADVVQFLGYGGALALLWLTARRLAEEIPDDDRPLSFVGQVVVPLATLIVLAAGYQVLYLLLGPFLGLDARSIYGWVFVAAITAAAVWLGLACYRNAGKLMSALPSQGRSVTGGSALVCPKCGAAVAAGVKFCGSCGHNTVSPLLCPSCGRPLLPGKKFCADCGSPVG